jgi:hypothetical protein
MRLTADQWPQVRQVYERALQCAAQDREAFLERACTGQPELRAQVDSLLRAAAAAGDFLEQPLVQLGVTDASVLAEHIDTLLLRARILGGVGVGNDARRARRHRRPQARCRRVRARRTNKR